MNTEPVSFGNRNLSAASGVLMLASAGARLIACSGGENGVYFVLSQIVLPLTANLLFFLCLLLDRPRLSSVPVGLGVLFFVLKSLTFESLLHTLLCIALYCTVLLIWMLTVFGALKKRVFAFLVFALPLAEHIASDISELANGADISGYLPELSVLCIMASLAVAALSTQKRS